MLELRVTGESLADIIQQMQLGFGETQQCCQPAQLEEPEIVEAEPVTTKVKRTRKKKDSQDTPVEDTPVEKIEDVRAVLIQTRERVGLEKVRELLNEMGGRLDDIPADKWGELVMKANALV